MVEIFTPLIMWLNPVIPYPGSLSYRAEPIRKLLFSGLLARGKLCFGKTSGTLMGLLLNIWKTIMWQIFIVLKCGLKAKKIPSSCRKKEFLKPFGKWWDKLLLIKAIWTLLVRCLGMMENSQSNPPLQTLKRTRPCLRGIP